MTPINLVFRKGFVVAALVAAAVSCGRTAEEAPTKSTVPPDASRPQEAVAAEPGEPVTGDWAIQRLPSDPPHLNPMLDTGDASASTICAHIFEGLLDRNKETLELEPVLAESYEVSDDHLTYTYRLNKAARFSDGVPVTAHDVKFTFDLITDPANETANWRNYFKDVAAVDVLDDYTIQFRCGKPYFRHLEITGGVPAYPRHVYGDEDIDTHSKNRSPVGSGPYVFDSWDTGRQITLRRDPDYWGEKKPYLDRIVYKIITDDNAAFQVLERQELDVMGLTPEQWVNRADRPEFEAKFDKYLYWGRTGYIGTYSYIGWNLRKPQFADKRVRRALTMLLDRQLILDTIFYGMGKIVTGSAFSESPEYNQNIEPWPFDPAAAAALLDEAGWRDSDQDGVRDKNGWPFAFEFLMPAGSREMEQLATVYKEELDRAGIDMTIRPLEWATFLENLTRRTFDAVTLAWAIPPDSDPYQVWHSSQAEKGSNYPGFKNEEADQIVEQIRMEFDRAERIKLWHRFHEILHEEQPYTFLFNTQARVAVDKRFENVAIYPMGLEVREWWTPLDRQRYK